MSYYPTAYYPPPYGYYPSGPPPWAAYGGNASAVPQQRPSTGKGAAYKALEARVQTLQEQLSSQSDQLQKMSERLATMEPLVGKKARKKRWAAYGAIAGTVLAIISGNWRPIGLALDAAVGALLGAAASVLFK